MLKGLSKFNLPEIEEKVLKFWKENSIFAKSLEQRKGKKQFILYEGPPTANARPGTHHVIGRVFKDIIPRFKSMQGYFVPRRAGWDTHGLPVEIEVEKELGIKSKPEIEKFGIAEFNQRAKASVWKYKEEWEKLTERIGFWLDLKHPYITYENSYIEKLWDLVKQIDKRKLLYKGHKVVPWCTRCGTTLSSHELAQGYHEVTDASVYIRFKIQDSRFKNTSIVSWTTTPWTLPGNVALAVNPKHTFARVVDPHEPGHWLILEKKSAERLGFMSGIRKTDTSYEDTLFTAKDIIGLSYEPLFAVQLLFSKKSYKVYPASFVSTDEGTGVVHTAVMYGEDDYALGTKIGLPQCHTVDGQGRFTKDVPDLAGLYVQDAATEEKIIKYLQTNNYVLKTAPYTHEYPFCWRCDSRLLYYAQHSWFIAMSKLGKQLQAANKKVTWVPKHIKDGRFGEWLSGVKDWALSRSRYWGTPLPVWECEKCKKYIVVGSVAELAKRGGAVPDDLHRPFIDAVMLRCPQCTKGKMVRVKEVIDVWFDSGAMPFASGEYPERYPADYICEAIDQTRGWFYTLLATGVLMKRGAPYKNVICHSHLLDKHGKKMSKSQGNAVDPWDVINQHGIDALRWYFYTSAIIKEPIRFDEHDVLKTSRRFISLLYNSYVFLQTYSGDTVPPSSHCKNVNVLDDWIIARLHETIDQTTTKLETYDIGGAAFAIEALVDDVSRWYIRRSRKRSEALPILGTVLLQISKLIAPFTPFFAEALYQGLREMGLTTSDDTNVDAASVHLTNWPRVEKKWINKKLIQQMAEVRRIASIALAKRAEAGIRVRQPLASLKIQNAVPPKELLEILKDEINVKEVVCNKKLIAEVELDIHITAALRKEGLYRELVRLVQGLRREAGCAPGDQVDVFIDGGIEAQKTIKERISDFLRDVNARGVSFQKNDRVVVHHAVDLDGVTIWAGVNQDVR